MSKIARGEQKFDTPPILGPFFVVDLPEYGATGAVAGVQDDSDAGIYVGSGGSWIPHLMGNYHQIGHWVLDDAPADSDLDMTLLGGGRQEIPSVVSGSVLGIVVHSSAARTAGTLTVEAVIDGTPTGLTAVLDGTNTQVKATSQERGESPFGDGALLGVHLVTSSDWAPTSADITVELLLFERGMVSI